MLNLKEAEELFRIYETSNVFEQNELAVKFMEEYAADLIRKAANCHCVTDDRKQLFINELDKLKLELERNVLNTKERVLNAL